MAQLEQVLHEFVGGRQIRLTYKPFDAFDEEAAQIWKDYQAAPAVQNGTMKIYPILLQPKVLMPRY
jgi:hypothetical protein